MADSSQAQREEFIDYWVEFMLSHTVKEWSRQQNIFINSYFHTSHQFSRKEYLELRGEKCWL